MKNEKKKENEWQQQQHNISCYLPIALQFNVLSHEARTLEVLLRTAAQSNGKQIQIECMRRFDRRSSES